MENSLYESFYESVDKSIYQKMENCIDELKTEIFMRNVEKNLPMDILRVVYYNITHTKEQKNKARTGIQKWYRSVYPMVTGPDGIDDQSKKSLIVRMMVKEYSKESLKNFPNFARRKLPHGDQKPLFSGVKPSQAVQWILENMTVQDLAYVGF